MKQDIPAARPARAMPDELVHHGELKSDFLAHCPIAGVEADTEAAAGVAPLQLSAEFSAQHLMQWAPEMLGQAEALAETALVKGLEPLSLGAVRSWQAALTNYRLIATKEKSE